MFTPPPVAVLSAFCLVAVAVCSQRELLRGTVKLQILALRVRLLCRLLWYRWRWVLFCAKREFYWLCTKSLVLITLRLMNGNKRAIQWLSGQSKSLRPPSLPSNPIGGEPDSRNLPPSHTDDP